MNKRQVEKHGEVIKWWIDNFEYGVWTKKDSNNLWEHVLEPAFDTKREYIENDMYSDLRKAEHDGKVIQFKMGSLWVNARTKLIFSGSLSNYRIKKEVLSGDWISFDGCDFVRVDHIDGRTVRTACGSSIMNADNCNIWSAEEGEECVVWNERSVHIVAKFKGVIQTGYKVFGSAEIFANIGPVEALGYILENRI